MNNIRHIKQITLEEGDFLLGVGAQLYYREADCGGWKSWMGVVTPTEDAEYALANRYVKYDWGVEVE